MDDGETTTPDPMGFDPPAPPALDPPPMPASLPPPTVAPVAVSKRRFPWVSVVVGVIALAAIVVLALLLVSTSSDKNDAEDALASAESDLADSEAALAAAQSDLSDTEAALAEAETARSEAEAARDEHEQRADAYEAASTDFLAASLAQGIGLEEDDAQCVADVMIDSLGPEAMTILASAALDGSGDVVTLDDEMRRAADDCEVPPEALGDPLDSDANAYGDDAELDALYDDCAGGDAVACDELYVQSPPGSEYEQFAGTCGDRFEYSDTEYCEGRF